MDKFPLYDLSLKNTTDDDIAEILKEVSRNLKKLEWESGPRPAFPKKGLVNLIKPKANPKDLTLKKLALREVFSSQMKEKPRDLETLRNTLVSPAPTNYTSRKSNVVVIESHKVEW